MPREMTSDCQYAEQPATTRDTRMLQTSLEAAPSVSPLRRSTRSRRHAGCRRRRSRATSNEAPAWMSAQIEADEETAQQGGQDMVGDTHHSPLKDATVLMKAAQRQPVNRTQSLAGTVGGNRFGDDVAQNLASCLASSARE
ncbi:uncharacterized protein FIBRA_09226 [Fibroporia radiculosa]|uniref:Uncharacterized protein n=1 Tax=Fibroporia radiculosa TaxID=599839 RepID=J7S652_9APHY|nr:uncharacterized protein FIBRA_09226 [Fibroporia radiculosa]CCM06914.1 predicted protein [Fibroporia radiculosa]